MEGSLVFLDCPCETQTVCAGHVAEHKLARATAKQMLATETWSQGDTVKELLGRKLATDGTFSMEHRLLAGILDEAGGNTIAGGNYALLPAQVAFAEFARASTTKIEELNKTGLFKFCPRSAQRGVTATAGILSNIAVGFPPPQFATETLTMMGRVRERLPLFARFIHSGGGKDDEVVELVGKDALEMKLSAMRAKVSSGTTVRFDVLEEFHVFAGFVSNDDKTNVQTLTRNDVQSFEGTSMEDAPVVTPADVKSTPKASAKAAAAKSDVKSASMSFFKYHVVRLRCIPAATELVLAVASDPQAQCGTMVKREG